MNLGTVGALKLSLNTWYISFFSLLFHNLLDGIIDSLSLYYNWNSRYTTGAFLASLASQSTKHSLYSFVSPEMEASMERPRAMSFRAVSAVNPIVPSPDCVPPANSTFTSLQQSLDEGGQVSADLLEQQVMECEQKISAVTYQKLFLHRFTSRYLGHVQHTCTHASGLW